MKLFLAVVLVTSFSMGANAHSKKRSQKLKIVTITFEETDIQKQNRREPASLVEKQEMEAQARSLARVNQNQWPDMEF